MVLHCLKASNTLRKQMFSTFGVAALFSLMVVVVSACFCVYRAGEIVKEHSSELMISHVADALKMSSRLMAEKLSTRLAEVDSSVQILVECLQDRIVGYPSMDGWQQETFVPFIDSTTQTPKYPLAMPPVPLDWNISLRSSILEDDALGERVRWYGNSSAEIKISTETAAFHFQGACNPDSESLDWIEGCSDSHNNVTSGGVFRPTSTHLGLYQSTGDLSVFMKPLFESQEEVLQFKIYFLNDGAGATLAYPASRIPPSAETYTSLGCDWLSSINVRTGEPYGTTEFCHSEGETVHSRNYNPMEEAWAPFFLEQPEDKVGSFGPLLDDPSVVKAGKAVYDRLYVHLSFSPVS
jgi:predicted metal-binding protein